MQVESNIFQYSTKEWEESKTHKERKIIGYTRQKIFQAWILGRALGQIYKIPNFQT